MACNGFNHPKNCKCNFRGGHANSRPPVWRGWTRSSIKRYTSGPNAVCPQCRAPVYFVPGPSGGGAYFEKLGPPWPKHPCTDHSKSYSPYNRAGIPKLRNRRSQFERDGWTPFIVRHVEELVIGTIIHGVAYDNPTVLHFGSFELVLNPDKERPIYFRRTKKTGEDIELNFFSAKVEEPVTKKMFDDCRSEFELLLKRPPGSP